MSHAALIAALIVVGVAWAFLVSIGMRRHARKKPRPDASEPAPAPPPPPAEPPPPSPAPVNVGKATVILVCEDGRRLSIVYKGSLARSPLVEAKNWVSSSFELGVFATEKDGQQHWYAARLVLEVLITVTDHFVTPGQEQE